MFFVEGATRADYNPIRYPISSLSIGDMGWMQMTNFIVTGLLLLAFALGLKRALQFSVAKSKGVLLIGLVGMGLIGAGICSSDPIYGYPPNKPLVLAQFTLHGHLHDFFSMFVFVCLPWACFIFRRRFIQNGDKGWASYSGFTGFAMPLAFVITAIGFKQVAWFADYAGAFQRLTLIIGFTWIALLGIRIMKAPLQE
jgi:hypothetical protein